MSENHNSRLKGLYDDDIATRRRRVERALGLAAGSLNALDEGLTLEAADRLVENVIGIHGLPIGVATNFVIDDRDRLIPMVVEEPSVVAAASNGARMARCGGGFRTATTDPIVIAQIELRAVPDLAAGSAAIEGALAEIGEMCDATAPTLVARGGGFRGVEVRTLGDGTTLVAHILVDCCDAMGANLANTMAETCAPRLAALTGGQIGLRILSNLSDKRLVEARCRIPPAALTREGFSGEHVRDGVVAAQRFAALDPYRASTHNKGVMNGVDALAVATGNDWRAVEAGAHAYAARSGRYQPLTDWRVGEDGWLEGHVSMPMSLGTVGGATWIHPTARLAREILGTSRATELARIAAAVGLAQNLGALAALASEGIQNGHMARVARARSLPDEE